MLYISQSFMFSAKLQLLSANLLFFQPNFSSYRPNPSRYQPNFRFFSQTHHDISQSFAFSAKPITISANLSLFQPNPSRYQPISSSPHYFPNRITFQDNFGNKAATFPFSTLASPLECGATG